VHRRAFLTGVVGFLAAPAIVRAGSLMPISVSEPAYTMGGARLIRSSTGYWVGETGELHEWAGGFKASGSYDALVEHWRQILTARANES
jgi:hypothetical protein